MIHEILIDLIYLKTEIGVQDEQYIGDQRQVKWYQLSLLLVEQSQTLRLWH